MADVLVVDDEVGTRVLLEARLRSAGHGVCSAASVPEAQELLDRVGAPQVVLTDLVLPGRSGLDLVASLRRDPRRAELPVILMSSMAHPDEVTATRALRAQYLHKPFTADLLERAVDAAVRAGSASVAITVRRRIDALGATGDPGRREACARLLDGVAVRVPQAVATVERAVLAGDGAGLLMAAGRLRRAATSLGVTRLAQHCAELEAAAHAGRLPTTRPVRTALRQDAAVTVDVLAALAQELRSGASAPR